jgi:hypothetical protein
MYKMQIWLLLELHRKENSMKVLYELKDRLTRELDEIAMQQDITESSLDIIDKLTHSIKSIETIIAMNETQRHSFDNYNSRDRYSSMDSYRSMDGYSERRGRDSMGRYTSREGYSEHKNDELKHQLEDIYQYTKDEQSRNMIQKWIKEL